jgi:5-formyltetrahydrofolate cyclo-ligase
MNEADLYVIKKELRRRMNDLRDSISKAEREHASEKAAAKVVLSKDFIECSDILLFSSYRSEISTEPLIREALKAGKNIYLPKVCDDEIKFYRYVSDDRLNEGYKGIPEPTGETEEYVPSPEKSGLVICPGLAFGRDGSRMGYGKGYYDRFLKKASGLKKTGICFDIQLLDTVPHSDKDMLMDVVISEKNEVKI